MTEGWECFTRPMAATTQVSPFSMCVYRIPQGTNYTRAACDYCYAHQRSHYVSPLRSWGPNIMPYLTTLALGDPRGANYVRTTRDLSPLVLSSKENSVFFTSTNCPIHRGGYRQADCQELRYLLFRHLFQVKLRASALLLSLPLS